MAEGRVDISPMTAGVSQLIKQSDGTCKRCVDLKSQAAVDGYIKSTNAESRRVFDQKALQQLPHELGKKPFLDGLPSAHYTSGNHGRFIQARFTYCLRGGGQLSILPILETPSALRSVFAENPAARDLEYWVAAIAYNLAGAGQIPIFQSDISQAIEPYRANVDKAAVIIANPPDAASKALADQLTTEVKQ